MSKKLRVLVVEPMKVPYVKEIEDNLESMQEIVGGDIEPICPFDDPVVLICNANGMLDGMTYNRPLKYLGMTYDIIQGPFFVAGLGEEFITSLTDNMIEKYTKLFCGELTLMPYQNPFGGLQRIY